MPIAAITCISFIGTQWFVLSWISNSFICSCVRVSGVIALMISSASFVLLSRKISCLSFDFSCSSNAFSYASFISYSEDLSNFFLMDKSCSSSSTRICFEWLEKHAYPWRWQWCWPLCQTSQRKKNQCCIPLLGSAFNACELLFLFSFVCRGAIHMKKHWWSFAFVHAQVTHCFFLSVAICRGARRQNFKLGTKG